MKFRFTRRALRLAMNCFVVTLVVFVSVHDAVDAEDFGCGGEIYSCAESFTEVPGEGEAMQSDASSPCFDQDLYVDRDLCAEQDSYAEQDPYGGQDLCGWATHDSCPIAPYPADAEKSLVVPATSSPLITSVSTEPASGASAQVDVQQIAEPFAIVGPQVAKSLEIVRTFQQWWSSSVQPLAAAPNAAAPNAEASETMLEVQQRLENLTMEEPVDVSDHDPRVDEFVDDGPSVHGPSVHGPSVLAINEPASGARSARTYEIVGASAAQIGASAVIFTIEDAYLPYDVSATDFRLWSVFPLVTEPLCVRGRIQRGETSPLWDNFDELALNDANDPTLDASAVTGESVAAAADGDTDDLLEIYGDPDCLIAQLLWEIGEELEFKTHTGPWLKPRTYGRKLASAARISRRVAANATSRLAAIWPDSDSPKLVPVVTAGDLLLARAGAIAASEPLVTTPPAEVSAAPAVQIAEVPSESSIR